MSVSEPSNSEFAAAQVHASKHRVEIEASEQCGCFFCFRTFAPSAIKSWTDGNQTALCPHCGVDSVLGSAYTQLGDLGGTLRFQKIDYRVVRGTINFTR